MKDNREYVVLDNLNIDDSTRTNLIDLLESVSELPTREQQEKIIKAIINNTTFNLAFFV